MNEKDLNFRPISIDRMVEAVEAVRNRLLKATAALRDAGVEYAVVGGNAVAVWVSRVDRSAVRNTQDVDILVRRADFDQLKAALEAAGFVYRQILGVECFLDHLDAHPRDSVHILFAGEKVRESYLLPSASVEERESGGEFDVIQLEALVRMKLTSFRLKDRVHLMDMIEVGMVDANWIGKFPTELGERLQELIDNPDG